MARSSWYRWASASVCSGIMASLLKWFDFSLGLLHAGGMRGNTHRDHLFLCRDESPLRGPHGDLCAGIQCELAENAADVVFDSAFADDQQFGDVTIGMAGGDGERHVLLATTQRPAVRGSRPPRIPQVSRPRETAHLGADEFNPFESLRIDLIRQRLGPAHAREAAERRKGA